MTSAPPSSDEIRLWLEWAGRALLALPSHGLYPARMKALDLGVAPDPTLAYGYNQTRLRPAAPSAEEIEWIDEILALPQVCEYDKTRRVLQSRALISPLNDRYIYSWAKIGRLLKLDPQTVKAMHARGLLEITRKADPVKVCRIRAFRQISEAAP